MSLLFDFDLLIDCSVLTSSPYHIHRKMVFLGTYLDIFIYTFDACMQIFTFFRFIKQILYTKSCFRLYLVVVACDLHIIIFASVDSSQSK